MTLETSKLVRPLNTTFYIQILPNPAILTTYTVCLTHFTRMSILDFERVDLNWLLPSWVCVYDAWNREACSILKWHDYIKNPAKSCHFMQNTAKGKHFLFFPTSDSKQAPSNWPSPSWVCPESKSLLNPLCTLPKKLGFFWFSEGIALKKGRGFY